jgi:hypothetical protein
MSSVQRASDRYRRITEPFRGRRCYGFTYGAVTRLEDLASESENAVSRNREMRR